MDWLGVGLTALIYGPIGAFLVISPIAFMIWGEASLGHRLGVGLTFGALWVVSAILFWP